MSGYNRPRSSSAPKERGGPRVLHKNTPHKQSPQQQKQQQQQQQQQQQYQQQYQQHQRQQQAKTPEGVNKLNLQALRPSSANSQFSFRASDGAITNRSPLNSNRSTCSLGDGEFNISAKHVGFASARGGTSSGTEKCICNICTCGKHHCPVRHVPNPAKLEATTSYANTFKEHSPDFYPTRARPNQGIFLNTKTTPGHYDTTHKSTFVAPEPEQHIDNLHQRMERTAAPHRRRENTVPEKFEHTTMQRSDYPWHDVAPPTRARPATASPTSSGPFYATTTAQDHFKKWDPNDSSIGRRSPSALRNSGSSPFPDSPVDFNTSYSNTFVEHSPQRSKIVRPVNNYSYGTPRDFTTSNKLDFAGKQNPACPATGLPPRPASARSGHVKYHLDYTGTWS